MIIFNGVPLEDVCPACKGNPPETTFMLIPFGKWCARCGRSGYVLNENGRVICQLIERYLTTNESNIRFKH